MTVNIPQDKITMDQEHQVIYEVNSAILFLGFLDGDILFQARGVIIEAWSGTE